MTKLTGKKRRNLRYKRHLITYLDIVGFRDLIAEESPNFISMAIRRVIEATAPDNELRRRDKEEYVNFSDLIVHTVPVDSHFSEEHRTGIVFDRVFDLLHGQAALVSEGLLLRGALTIGNIERTYGVLFGPGLIHAYDMERQKAQFPRILLDPFLLQELENNPNLRMHKYKEEMEYLSPYLRKDTDGFVFIDYLGGLQSEYSPGDYRGFLSKHKTLIEGGLAEFQGDTRIRPKYEWLKRYHNDIVIDRLGEDQGYRDI